MPQLKISQGPQDGSPDLSVQSPTDQTRAMAAPATLDSHTLASASLGLQRGDTRQPGQDTRLPENGEQHLAVFGRSRDVTDAENTLGNHSLKGSFLAHFEKQFAEGKIRIGVIDDFGPNTTHGRNVEDRILSQMPENLRGMVEIVRYDVAGLDADGRARVIAQAAQDAKDKDLLALSVSGGINAYPVANIERLIGGRDLTQDTARDAYGALIRNNGTSEALQNAMRDLNAASYKIPVVTPIWNNDSTTLPALLLGSDSGNGIITSIDRPAVNPGGHLYKATEIDGLADVRVPGAPGNPNTSQSAPYFIGNLLRYAWEQHGPHPMPRPGPRPSANADLEGGNSA
jgi:hypothetical protein